MDINELDARTKKFLIQFCREGLMYGEEGNVSTLFKLLIERGFVESSYKGFRLVFYPTKNCVRSVTHGMNLRLIVKLPVKIASRSNVFQVCRRGLMLGFFEAKIEMPWRCV